MREVKKRGRVGDDQHGTFDPAISTGKAGRGRLERRESDTHESCPCERPSRHSRVRRGKRESVRELEQQERREEGGRRKKAVTRRAAYRVRRFRSLCPRSGHPFGSGGVLTCQTQPGKER